MKHLKLIIFTLVFLLSAKVGFGQEGMIKGTLTDIKNQEPLIGVKIVLDSAGGTYSDMNGGYELKVLPGKHVLDFKYVGYDDVHKEVEVPGKETVIIDQTMGEIGTQLDIVVISGSQYEKKLGEETVSIDVIKPYLIENTAAVDLSDVTRKVPGVSIVDGQVSIRGMSGYAYGTGSRVQVLVDDMPLLGGDLSDVKWEFVPMENIEQIEVIKGASSALYGSSAMNGVINVRTGYARSKPETKVQLYTGYYRAPKREELRWWDWNENPFYTGFFVSDRRRWKNIDIVSGGNFHSAKSYLQAGDDTRARFNLKTRWKPKTIPGLSAGININAMTQKRGRFFLWTDKDAGAYKPLAGTESRERYEFYSIDPHVTYLSKKGTRHVFRGRYFNVLKKLRSQSNRLASEIYRGEYQVHHPFANNLHLTAGVVARFSQVRSNLLVMGGDTALVAPTFLGAAYTQLEKKFGNLSLVAGLRYELNIQPDFKAVNTDSIPALMENTGPVLRFGANYKIGKATFLRASFGEAYRFPALSERYIDESLAGLRIFPNPELRPESGHSIEIGVKQGVKIGQWRGYADAALFWADYYDMIEFRFVILQGDFGFQMQNITRARIAGLEVSGMGEGSIGPIPFRFYGGYTFNFPADLESDPTQRNIGTFLGNMFSSIGGVDSMQNSILRYRFRHMAQLDAEADYGKFTVGLSLGYNTFMDRIDEVFDFIVPGVTEWRANNQRATAMVNARIIFRPNPKTSISVLGKNLGNTEVSYRPGMMEAPGMVILQYMYKF